MRLSRKKIGALFVGGTIFLQFLTVSTTHAQPLDIEPDLTAQEQPFNITQPASRGSQTAADARTEAPRAATSPTGSDDIGCGDITTNSGGKTFAICVSGIVYWIAALSSNIAYIAAYFFSFMVQISLNSATYALDFISTGWTITRDLANMAFLFILIYIALTIMLQAETTNTIQMLAMVVVIALLVNFSFFFTRVVIDAGNILAVQFYNAIVVTGPNPTIGNGTKDLTAGIMGAVQIQSLYGTESFKQFVKDQGAMTILITLSLVYISAAAMFMILTFAFLQVGIKFLMRVVGLWLVIVASPVAFVTYTVDRTKKFFDQWLEYLIKFSFYPAIFLLTFYLLSIMVKQMGNGNLVQSIFNSMGGAAASEGSSGAYQIATAVANVGIRMGFIVAMLYFGLKVSDYIVTEGNKAARWFSGSLTGLAAASVGFAGRQTFGRGFNRLSQSPTFQRAVDRAENTNINRGLWRGVSRGTKRLADATFDVRNAPGVGTLKDIIGDSGKGKEKGIAQSLKEKSEREVRERSERAAIIRDAANRASIEKIRAGKGTADDERRIEGLRKRDLEGTKAADIESIAHIIKEGQLKSVLDSDKFTDAEKDKIEKIADPITKSQKIVVDELRKLNSNLRSGVHAAVVGTNTTRGHVLNDMSAVDMRTDIQTQITSVRAAMSGVGVTPADLTNMRHDLNQLHNALNSIDELRRNVAKIPTHTGRNAREMAVR